MQTAKTKQQPKTAINAREVHGQTDGQWDRQMDRQTGRQRDRQMWALRQFSLIMRTDNSKNGCTLLFAK